MICSALSFTTPISRAATHLPYHESCSNFLWLVHQTWNASVKCTKTLRKLSTSDLKRVLFKQHYQTKTRSVLCSILIVEVDQFFFRDFAYAIQLWIVFPTPWRKTLHHQFPWSLLFVNLLKWSMETTSTSRVWFFSRRHISGGIQLLRRYQVSSPNLNWRVWAQPKC